MSVSVIMPISDKIIFVLTSSCFIWEMAFFIASEDPWTSDLIIIFNSSEVLSLKAESCVTKAKGFLPSRFSWILASHNDLASFSFSSTTKSSPAFAAPLIPKTSTGVDGFASFTLRPWSLIKALTFPHFSPLTK